MKTRKRFKQRSIHAVLSIGLWLAGLPMFAQQPFVVEGEIEGLEDGISLQLLKQEGEIVYPYRTVWLQAGDKVRLTGKGL